jgi:hypothetical protein
VAQGIGPEFKPQYCKKKKQNKNRNKKTHKTLTGERPMHLWQDPL